MREPDLVLDIVRAMRKALTIPFTVKMRAGWDHEHKNAPDLAYMCQEEGVEAVTVHWRTRVDLYGGVRELDTLAAVVDRVSIPVMANGDIVDAPSALDTLARTGAEGLMIGRGAIRNPWVFREIEAALQGRPVPVVDAAERRRVLLGYFEAIRTTFRSDKGALGRMKKIARYFTSGVAFGDRLRPAILYSHTVEEAMARAEDFFDRLARHEAGDVDAFEGAPQATRAAG